MNADPLLAAALRHWGARDVPFTESPGANPFLSPAWEQALRLLQQTAALRSLMLLVGDNGAGKSALVAYWLERLEPKAYLPLVITHATLSGSGLLAVLLRKLGQPASLIRSRNLARLEDALKELGRLTPTPGPRRGPTFIRRVRWTKCVCSWASISPVSHLRSGAGGRPLPAGLVALATTQGPFTPASAPLSVAAFGARPDRTLSDPRLAPGRFGTSLLSPAALDLLAGASNGNPRLLNLLARAAWIAAAQAGVNTIGPEQVQTALNLVPSARDKINP